MGGGQTPDCVYLGDDFTGASDTLATWSRRGRASRLFLEPPSAEATRGLDAVGLATALRSMDRQRMSAEIDLIGPALARVGAPFFHYKVCSTFDSSPEIGNIAAALDGLKRHIAPSGTVIIGGQPSLKRHCMFGHLFAGASDGAVHRIDRHPVMADHPVTPMRESDLRRHLADQGLADIALIDVAMIEEGAGAVAARLAETFAGPFDTVLVDAARQAHIETIGHALRHLAPGGPILLAGASSVAEALCQEPVARGTQRTEPESCAVMPTGPVFVFAGSRSSVTASQVAAADGFERVAISGAHLNDRASLAQISRTVRGSLSHGRSVLAHLDPRDDYAMPPDRLAQVSARFVAQAVADLPLGGIGIAGGDTSSLVVRELGVRSLTHAFDLAPGVALCRAERPGGAPILMMLKGGQMGGADLFNRFADYLRHA